MAKFKCKNCDFVSDTFCDSALDATNVQCKQCGSHWVEKIEVNAVPIFPVLPYTDPIPPICDGYKFWCVNSPTTSTGY